MRTIVKPLPHDLGVKAALETTGKPVGWGEAPDGALAALLDTDEPGPDYFVLYRVSSQHTGTLSDPYADAGFVYQFTSVGRLPDGAAYLTGLIEEALLGATIADRVITEVEPLLERGPLPDRDIGPPHPFYAISQYRLHTVPA